MKIKSLSHLAELSQSMDWNLTIGEIKLLRELIIYEAYKDSALISKANQAFQAACKLHSENILAQKPLIYPNGLTTVKFVWDVEAFLSCPFFSDNFKKAVNQTLAICAAFNWE